MDPYVVTSGCRATKNLMCDSILNVINTIDVGRPRKSELRVNGRLILDIVKIKISALRLFDLDVRMSYVDIKGISVES